MVAVSTAAEYSGPGASGGNLSGVNCGPSSGSCPGPGPGSWSRSLDRALEEAAITGVLSLSGRKLREFPRGAANHDLTDTTRAGERGGRHSYRGEAPGAAGAAPAGGGTRGESALAVTALAPGSWVTGRRRLPSPPGAGRRASPRAWGERPAASLRKAAGDRGGCFTLRESSVPSPVGAGPCGFGIY